MTIAGTTCCGLRELHTLDGVTVAEVKARLKQVDLTSRGAVFATTNQTQKEAAKVLKAAGFVAIDTFYNPNSYNQVTLWYTRINQPEGQPKQLLPRPILKKCECLEARMKKALKA